MLGRIAAQQGPHSPPQVGLPPLSRGQRLAVRIGIVTVAPCGHHLRSLGGIAAQHSSQPLCGRIAATRAAARRTQVTPEGGQRLGVGRIVQHVADGQRQGLALPGIATEPLDEHPPGHQFDAGRNLRATGAAGQVLGKRPPMGC